MGKRQAGAGLIRETVQNTLTHTGDILAQHVQDHLFNHKNQIIMAFNFDHIKSLPDVAALLQDKGFREEYIRLYNDAHGSKNGAAHFARESSFVKRMFLENEKIRTATPLSMAMAMANLAYHGVSIDPVAKALAYILPRGGDNKVVFSLSGWGQLALRMRYQVVTSVNGPYLIFKGDTLKITNGKVFHDMAFQSEEITGGWMTVNRPDGTSCDHYFSIAQLNNYKKKGAGTGEAWTGGIEVEDEEGNTKKQATKGMLEAKIMLHTMDLYPIVDRKLRNGTDILTADVALSNAYADADEDVTAQDDDKDDDGLYYTVEAETQETQAPAPVTKAAAPKVQTVDPTDF